MNDENPVTQVDADVAYLRSLAQLARDVATAPGLLECAEAATHSEGRAILFAVLCANQKWRDAMGDAVAAFDATSKIVRDALGTSAHDPSGGCFDWSFGLGRSN